MFKTRLAREDLIFPRLSFFSLLVIMPVIVCLNFTGCANIQSPMGGPKDTIPPVLIKATPAKNTLNFKGNELKFEFNEYIKLENLNDNLIINPPAERYPIISSKLRNLSVKIKDTLEPNTTYTINFGKAITDVNEGNPLRDFTYAFSTGPYIDSLELTGKVIDAETGLPDSTLTVILHSKEGDSVVVKEKPRFVTRLNGQGVFHFDHLPSGKFFIYALKDEGIKRYTSNQIPFAFYDEQVTAGSSDSIQLRSFIGEKEAEKKPGLSLGGKNAKSKTDENKFAYNTSVTGSAQDLLSPLVINFEHPVKELDSSKILLADTLFNPMTGYSLKLDTSATRLELVYPWKDDAFYKLLLAKGFAADSAGTTTRKADTISFKTKAESEYGALKLVFHGIDMARNPVLQFVENNEVKQHFNLTGNVFTVKLFEPGQYKIRILYDANKNGIWDTGDYWKKIQPEFVVPVTETISVKPNWDNEVEITL